MSEIMKNGLGHHALAAALAIMDIPFEVVAKATGIDEAKLETQIYDFEILTDAEVVKVRRFVASRGAVMLNAFGLDGAVRFAPLAAFWLWARQVDARPPAPRDSLAARVWRAWPRRGGGGANAVRRPETGGGTMIEATPPATNFEQLPSPENAVIEIAKLVSGEIAAIVAASQFPPEVMGPYDE